MSHQIKTQVVRQCQWKRICVVFEDEIPVVVIVRSQLGNIALEGWDVLSPDRIESSDLKDITWLTTSKESVLAERKGLPASEHEAYAL